MGVSTIGNILSAVGGLKYTGGIFRTNLGGFWRGVNGNYYSMSQSLTGSGSNFMTNSMDLAKGVSAFKYMRIGGNLLGGATTLYYGYKFIKNPNIEDGLNTSFGVGAFIYWPIGVGYLGGKFLYDGQMRHCNWMYQNGLHPGKDDLMWMWKP